VIIISSVIIITLQIKGPLNAPIVYHSDKTKAQLLGSRLKQWNLLEKCVRMSIYRNRPSDIAMYYSMDSDLLYCNYFQELMEQLQLEDTPEQWRLFNEKSTVSLKAVLLQNAIPLAHAVHMQEMYQNLQALLQKIHYEEHQLNICGDLKVIAMMTGQQGDYIKFCCFEREWGRRARDCYYRLKILPHSETTRSEECGTSCFSG
jgi:hypothetical protein